MNRNRLLSVLSIVAVAAAGSDCVDESAKKCKKDMNCRYHKKSCVPLDCAALSKKKCEKIAKRGKCAYEKNKPCAPPADKCAKKAEGKCKCKKNRCCAWTGAACAADRCAAHSKKRKCLRAGRRPA
jgi:hypothetical protein